MTALSCYDNKKHNVPHIYVEYQGKEAVISIENCEILSGEIHHKKMNSSFFKELQDWNYFRQVRISGRTVQWPHEQDIAPETLYLEGKEFQEVSSIAEEEDKYNR